MKNQVCLCVFCRRVVRLTCWAERTHTHTHTLSRSMPISPPADGKHEGLDRPRQQHAPTNGNHGDDSIRASPGSKSTSEPMEDLHGNAVVIRIGIPDLQQTVSALSLQSSFSLCSHTHTPICISRLTQFSCLFFEMAALQCWSGEWQWLVEAELVMLRGCKGCVRDLQQVFCVLACFCAELYGYLCERMM